MLREKVIVFDGGLGSEIEAAGYGEHIPEDLNITHPEVIRKIHLSYKNADIISANTFGLNRIKYKGAYNLADVLIAAVENARVAGKKVFLDVGPTGALTEPTGSMTFDEAYGAFAEVAEITKNEVDGYIVETFSDLYELKACVLALKEHTDKPVFATMTFDAAGRTLSGATPEIAALMLEGLGVDALGVNCSLGPKQLKDIVSRFLKVSGVPVIVQPNRGLPKIKDGKTYYDMSADDFVRAVGEFVEAGVSVIGGCCGTTPEFTDKLCAAYRGKTVKRESPKRETAVASGSRYVVIDGVKICGERLNPTGKKKLKEALAAGDYDYLAGEAVAQKDAGADILDLNVGLPTIDERETMRLACKKVQSVSDLPLQIDSSDKDAIEAGVRYCCGVPIINSVNGEEEIMARVFPIAKKYGAVVLGLTMDEKGVPKTAEERFEIAKRIISRAADYGIESHKIMIDTLVLTASAEQALVKETLKAIRLVKTLGAKVALGVSNVSFGLPNRPLLNRTFLSMALECGLNMPIMNPLDGDMTGTVNAYKVLENLDAGSENYIDLYRDFTPQTASVTAVGQSAGGGKASAESLYDCVIKGLKASVEELTRKELLRMDAMEIVNDVLIPALEEVGKRYDSGAFFLPQLISASEAAKTAFAVVGEYLPKGLAEKGIVVLATVKGDVHDIGKNIVKIVLESHSYSVIDLGKDVPEQNVIEAAKKYSPIAVGLSALMTTTVPSMERTIKAVKAAGLKMPVFVGGAVLTQEIANQIGADYYTENALEFVKVLERLML